MIELESNSETIKRVGKKLTYAVLEKCHIVIVRIYMHAKVVNGGAFFM
jgi:hypothetical protein